MDAVVFALTAIGTIAGVISAYFTYVAIRHQLSRRRRSLPAPPRLSSGADARSDPAEYDVFVSHSRQDAEWVTAFVERLQGAGLRVASDEIVLRPGDVLIHSVEEAIRRATHGLLVFSPASMDDGWTKQEYATLMQRSIETGQRFIPVLIGSVELPEFAANRHYCDFRGLDGRAYQRRVDEIARALRGDDA